MSLQGFFLLLVAVNVVLVQSPTTRSYRPSRQQTAASQHRDSWFDKITHGIKEGIKEVAPLLTGEKELSKEGGLVKGVSNLLGIDSKNNHLVHGILQTAVSALSKKVNGPRRVIRDVHVDDDQLGYGQNNELSAEI